MHKTGSPRALQPPCLGRLAGITGTALAPAQALGCNGPRTDPGPHRTRSVQTARTPATAARARRSRTASWAGCPPTGGVMAGGLAASPPAPALPAAAAAKGLIAASGQSLAGCAAAGGVKQWAASYRNHRWRRGGGEGPKGAARAAVAAASQHAPCRPAVRALAGAAEAAAGAARGCPAGHRRPTTSPCSRGL